MNKTSDFKLMYKIAVKDSLSLPIVRFIIIPTILASITAAFLEIKISETIKVLSRNISHNKPSGEALKYFFFIGLAAIFLSEAVGLIFTGVVQYINRITNKNTFKQVMCLPLKSFNKIGNGEIQAIIERKSKASAELLEIIMGSLLPIVCNLCFVTVSVSKELGPWPCLLILISVFIYGFITINIAKWRASIRAKLNQAENASKNKLNDSLMNHETVYCYGTTEFEAKRYDAKLKDIESNANTLWRALYVLNFLQRSTFHFQNTLVIFLALNAYFSVAMSPENLIFFIAISRTLNNCLGNLGYMYSRYTQAMLCARATYDETPYLVMEQRKTNTPITFNDMISLQDVSFYYDNKKMFEHINLDIKKGEKVAIIGKNGVGKSTLIKLLLRFEKYDGQIFMDDQNIQDIDEDSFRKTLTYIPQTSFLFKESVLFNIKYGNINISNEEVYKISKQFGCFETFNNLKEGFETNVGEQGNLLSGGERQKILLMRALLNKKNLFILDEPTSALDKEAELRAIDALMGGDETTLVMIIHNLELISMFDKVLFIHDYKVEIIKNENEYTGTSSEELSNFLQTLKVFSSNTKSIFRP